MSGETQKDESGWTVDTVNYFLQRQIDDLKTALDERYATQTKAVDAAFLAQQTAMRTAQEAQQTAMQTAFSAADKAVDKAREADQKAVDKALEAAEKAVVRRQDTLDREFHEHLEQVRHENALAFINSDKAIQAAFSASDRAISKAEAANEKRFESVNEFRAQLTDQTASFMPREVAEAALGEIRHQLTSMTTRLDLNTGKSTGYAALYGWAIAAVGLIVSVSVSANAIFGG